MDNINEALNEAIESLIKKTKSNQIEWKVKLPDCGMVELQYDGIYKKWRHRLYKIKTHKLVEKRFLMFLKYRTKEEYYYYEFLMTKKNYDLETYGIRINASQKKLKELSEALWEKLGEEVYKYINELLEEDNDK